MMENDGKALDSGTPGTFDALAAELVETHRLGRDGRVGLVYFTRNIGDCYFFVAAMKAAQEKSGKRFVVITDEKSTTHTFITWHNANGADIESVLVSSEQRKILTDGTPEEWMRYDGILDQFHNAYENHYLSLNCQEPAIYAGLTRPKFPPADVQRYIVELGVVPGKTVFMIPDSAFHGGLPLYFWTMSIGVFRSMGYHVIVNAPATEKKYGDVTRFFPTLDEVVSFCDLCGTVYAIRTGLSEFLAAESHAKIFIFGTLPPAGQVVSTRPVAEMYPYIDNSDGHIVEVPLPEDREMFSWIRSAADRVREIADPLRDNLRFLEDRTDLSWRRPFRKAAPQFYRYFIRGDLFRFFPSLRVDGFCAVDYRFEQRDNALALQIRISPPDQYQIHYLLRNAQDKREVARYERFGLTTAFFPDVEPEETYEAVVHIVHRGTRANCVFETEPVRVSRLTEKAAPVVVAKEQSRAEDRRGIPAEWYARPRKPPMKVVFSIDTEHHYGGIPTRISGDLTPFGIEENYGVRGIMDEFEKAGARAVFFVNVYEAHTFSEGYEHYMEDLLREIHARGHEIGLHWHSNRDPYFPHSDLLIPNVTEEQEREVIRAGLDFVESCTGYRPVSYRSGGYRCDEALWSALEAEGIQVDSTCWYREPRNFLSSWKTISQVCRLGGLYEFPVVPVINRWSGYSKLDVQMLSLEEILQALSSLRRRADFPYVQIMFHSFSFLDGRSEKAEPILVFGNGRTVIFGGNAKKKEELRKLLSYLTVSPDYEICTFRDLLAEGIRVPSPDSDGIAAIDHPRAREETVFFTEHNYYSRSRGCVVHLPVPEDTIIEAVLSHSYEVRGGHLWFQVHLAPSANGKFQFQFEIVNRGANRVLQHSNRQTEPEYAFSGIPAGNYSVSYRVFYKGREKSYYVHGVKVPEDLPMEPLRLGHGIGNFGISSPLDRFLDTAEYTVNGPDITLSVGLRDPGKDMKLKFYLLRVNEVLRTTAYSDSPVHTFENVEPGKYNIKFYLRSGEETKSYLVRDILVGKDGGGRQDHGTAGT